MASLSNGDDHEEEDGNDHDDDDLHRWQFYKRFDV